MLCQSRQPLLDGARTLIARGADPLDLLEMIHEAKPDTVAMRGHIGAAAKWTVREGKIVSPTFTRWMPFPDTRQRPPMRSKAAALSQPARPVQTHP